MTDTIDAPFVVVTGTCDTKSDELVYLRDLVRAAGVAVKLVDVSPRGSSGAADVTTRDVLAALPGAAEELAATGDRGQAVAIVARAFAAWVDAQAPRILGMIGAGGSGNTALITPGMGRLPVGTPKIMISTVASGDVAPYVGPNDIAMLYSVVDLAGLNSISRRVLGNAANMMAGAVTRLLPDVAEPEKPALGLTMFGVTTPCIEQVVARLEADYECFVFHATGTGGRTMEKLADSGRLAGMIDVTTTEVADLLMGGVMSAGEDRLGAAIRTRLPYVGSCGALDMVNFGGLETVPARYRDRQLHVHNAQVTLMRTTPEENDRMGRWIGERLNRMEGEVRFLLPLGGVSVIDVPGAPFHDPEADAALFAALRETVRQTDRRRLVDLPHAVNDAAFAEAVVAAFLDIAGR
ncbi:Tm-1-like ATP-binding domain-containing protein [Tistrella mobilis]|uniref:Tm-1-like ATP-binding domain-containing protein n=1 Tax=Tistrella mobilis TaxID=171437 RepID=UPI0035570602